MMSNSAIHWLLILAMISMATIFIYSPTFTEAIYCWQCNSAQDKFCEDVPEVKSIDTLHDCYKKIYKECSADNDKLNYTFCRKQVQTIDKETRIIRACGFIRAPQDCYWTKNPQVTTLVCQCEGDGCNHAYHTFTSISMLTTVGLPILVTFMATRFNLMNA